MEGKFLNDESTRKSCESLFADDTEEIEDDSDAASEENGEIIPETLQLSGKRALEDTAESDEIRKKKMKRDRDLFKQPTVEELNQLRETENLFHSNLFRLQIDEVLTVVEVKPKYRKLFQVWFAEFKKTVQSIEETEEISVS